MNEFVQPARGGGAKWDHVTGVGVEMGCDRLCLLSVFVHHNSYQGSRRDLDQGSWKMEEGRVTLSNGYPPLPLPSSSSEAAICLV